MTTVEEYFSGHRPAVPLFEAVRGAVDELGGSEMRVTKSQIAFVRRTGFAWVWTPDRYLGPGHAPLVLSVSLRRQDGSPRWKQVVEPAAGRFMHHLELRDPAEVDGEVRAWLREAWEAAG